MDSKRGRLFVIAGPSGVGKGTIVKELLKRRQDMSLSISLTTRPKRVNEHDGIDYRFVSDEEFADFQKNGRLLESAVVHGHLYGTLKSEVEKYLSSDISVILEIDVQGAKQIKESGANAVFIFVTVPQIEDLRDRLIARQTESDDDLELRMKNAQDELYEQEWFDYIVVNDDLDNAINRMLEIVDKETRK